MAGPEHDHHDHGGADHHDHLVTAEHPHGHHDDHGRGLGHVLRAFVVPHSHDVADSLDQELEASRDGVRAVAICLVKSTCYTKAPTLVSRTRLERDIGEGLPDSGPAYRLNKRIRSARPDMAQ